MRAARRVVGPGRQRGRNKPRWARGAGAERGAVRRRRQAGVPAHELPALQSRASADASAADVRAGQPLPGGAGGNARSGERVVGGGAARWRAMQTCMFMGYLGMLVALLPSSSQVFGRYKLF